MGQQIECRGLGDAPRALGILSPPRCEDKKPGPRFGGA
jgi:hypothetical protein